MIKAGTEERFLKDTADHRVRIIRDDGIHRNSSFRKPGTRGMIQSIKDKLNIENLSISLKITLGYCIISIVAVAIVVWVALSLVRSSKQFTSFSTVSQRLAKVTLPHNNVAYELMQKFTGVSELFSAAIANDSREPLGKVQAEVKAISTLINESIPAGNEDPELEVIIERFNRYAEEGEKVVSKYLLQPESVDLTDLAKMAEDISALEEQLGKFQSSRSDTLGQELNEIALSADALNRQNQLLLRGSSVIALISLVVAVVLSLIIASGIVRPIAKVVHLGNAISRGDLSERLNMERQDEIGRMAMVLDDSCRNLSEMIAQIKSNADMLAGSSEEMSAVSEQMASSAEEMTSQADAISTTTEDMSFNINAIASAAEEMSVNVQNVSATASHVSQNMNTVASSIHQMSTALHNVASSVQEGAGITGKAMDMSTAATDTMNLLGDAAKDIGQVTALIKRIAERTNLLALNATIEAASAGDAGKGFAVVASEIKELANQSAKAAEDIATRILGTQTNTQEAVMVIAEIADIISKINESSLVITTAVEEQKNMADQVSDNVQQASIETEDIASSIAEISKGANDMARNAGNATKGVYEVLASIQEVSKASSASNTGAQQVSTSAGALAMMAGELQKLVDRFKVEKV